MTAKPTMPNNILVGSEKLFRSKAPWTLDTSFLGLFSQDHTLLLFNTDNDNEIQRKTTQKLSLALFTKAQKEHDNLLFIGYENECRMIIDLHEKFKFNFDCVVLVNNPYEESMYSSLYGNTNLYNFYTNSKGFDLAGADINQRIKTTLPAYMSKRLALEVFGCVVYGAYEKNGLESQYGDIIYV